MSDGASILVVGGAGYIGSHTAKALAAAGHRPVVLDHLGTGHRWAVRWGPLVQADLADGDAVRRALEEHAIEAVIHFAAHAYVGESMHDPRKYFRNNVANTLNLLDAMLERGVRKLVFSSSCTVYGEPRRLPIDEAHPRAPISPYGDSKFFIERVLQWYAQAYRFESVALRYFNAAGADPEGEIGELHDPETHLIPLTLDTALGHREALSVFGTDYPTPDGTALRDYVHVSDLASAHVRAVELLRHDPAEAEPVAPIALNLGTGRSHSVLDIVRAVEKATGREVPLRFEPRRPGDPAELVADARAARERLGWEPSLSDLDTIVGTAAQWHRRREPRPR